MRPGNRNGFPSDGNPLKRTKFIACIRRAYFFALPREEQVAMPSERASEPIRKEKHRCSSTVRGSRVRFYYSSARFSDANQPPLFTLNTVKRFKHRDGYPWSRIFQLSDNSEGAGRSVFMHSVKYV